MDPRKREVYMGVPAVRGEKEQSYEECRVADYSKAYQTTGRPPLPCPQQPTNPTERVALGLPPLFEPYVEQPGAPNLTPVASTSSTAPAVTAPTPSSGPSITATVTDINDIPQVQVFQPTTIRGDTSEAGQYQSIVLRPEFAHFSFEELRFQAYRSGKKTAPEAVTANATAAPSNPVVGAAFLPSGPPSTEALQSITSTPAYAMHSFEELRIAYIKFGREASSDEIIRQNSTLRLTA